jgi:hypothetical protein
MGALAASASAAPPGFHTSPRLAPVASFVAGKPMTVLCANSNAEWRTYLDDNGYTGRTANGATVVGTSVSLFSPIVCSSLILKLRGKTVANNLFGPSLLGLTHEAIHARGTFDEGKTDCAAVHEMPRVAVKFFGVTAGKKLRAVMAATWVYRGLQPAAYRTVC